MIKKNKFLKLCVDNVVISSTKAPESIDEFHGTCPACGSSKYTEVVTVVQHGMIEDDCITVVRCETCLEAFHYYYQVEAACLDECITAAFNPRLRG